MKIKSIISKYLSMVSKKIFNTEKKDKPLYTTHIGCDSYKNGENSAINGYCLGHCTVPNIIDNTCMNCDSFCENNLNSKQRGIKYDCYNR